MFIYIEDEIIELENDGEKIKSEFKIIVEKLGNSKLEYIIADGKAVTSDIENYLVQNINDIQKVIIVTDTTLYLVRDTIDTSEGYIRNAVPLIQELANGFYVTPSDKMWLNLLDLFEGIQWIIESVMKMDKIKNSDKVLPNYSTWNEYVQSVSKLYEIIPELQVAMESQDNVLIGDLLLYEIIPVFEKMQGILVFLASKKGDIHVS